MTSVDSSAYCATRRDTAALVIALVILLGAVELRGGYYLRDDRAREFAGFIESPFRFLGGLPRVVIGIKNYGPVLSADVGSLPIERRRVMNLPKHFQQLLERYPRRVVLHLHDFGVSRLATANRSVVGLWNRAGRVSCGRIDDAFDRAKSRFHSPEASGAKCRDSVLARHLIS